MRRPLVFLCVGISAFLALAASAADASRVEQTIVKGRSATVELPFAAGTGANSNPDVVQAKVDGKSILLFGREPGYATYTIWSRDKKRSLEISVVVSERDMVKVFRDLTAALSEFEQVTVKMSGGDVIVDGEVATLEELQRVNRIVSRYEGPGLRNDLQGR
jgi:Flp pilus assembly secretin CpaC